MHWFIFICVSLIFLITPFQEGLFFNTDYYPIDLILFIIFLVFIIRLFIRNDFPIIKRYIIVFLLPLSYIVSLPFSESPKGAWDSVLKWLFYSSFFILLIWTASKSKIKQLLPLLFQLSGVCIALSMIFDYYGWIHYPNAIVDNRFGGVFQYPNTFGVVMVLFFFYSLVNLTEEKISTKKLFIPTSLSLIYFVCFLQSSSRGMMMFFPIIWLAGLLLLPVKSQLKYLTYSIINILSALIVYQSMIKDQSSEIQYPSLFLFLVMILLSNAVIFFINWISAKGRFPFQIKKGSRFALPLVIVVILISGFLDIRYHGLVFHRLPLILQDRLGSINLRATSAIDRLTFFKDAIRMSESSPIVGFGGGGWEAVYNNFQSFPYIANKIHNGYMEWVIETGWLGFSLFLTVFVYFFYLLLRSYLSERNPSSKASVILALLTIFIHSFIDFNFSFGTVWLLIFWLFAMAFSDLPMETQVIMKQLKKQVTKQDMKSNWKYKAILTVCSIGIIIGLIQSYRFVTAEQYNTKAKAANNISLKEELFQKAVNSDPDNITYMHDLAAFYIGRYKQSYDINYRNKAEQWLEIMAKTEPQNSNVLYQNAQFSEMLGNDNQALKYFNQAISIDHFNAPLYQDSIMLKVNMAIEYRNRHAIKISNELLNSAIANFQQEELWYGKVDQSLTGESFNRDFHITPSTQFYSGLAFYIKKDYLQVVKVTKESNEKGGGNLHALRILANEKLGLKDQMGQSENVEGNLGNLRKMLQNM